MYVKYDKKTAQFLDTFCRFKTKIDPLQVFLIFFPFGAGRVLKKGEHLEWPNIIVEKFLFE